MPVVARALPTLPHSSRSRDALLPCGHSLMPTFSPFSERSLGLKVEVSGRDVPWDVATQGFWLAPSSGPPALGVLPKAGSALVPLSPGAPYSADRDMRQRDAHLPCLGAALPRPIETRQGPWLTHLKWAPVPTLQ